MRSIASAAVDWSQLAQKNVLITGAAGFLPAYMVEALLYLNDHHGLRCKILGLVRNRETARQRFAAYMGRQDLQLIEGDASGPVSWPHRCDVLIHAASQASPKFYGPDPVGTMTTNILGTYHLLTQARQWGVQSFLFFSSGEVYGQVSSDQVPTKETDYGWIDINAVRSCYSEGKRAAETLGVSYFSQFGVPFKIVRPFHTYGPKMRLDDGRVFADFVRDLVDRRNLQIRSDGKAIRAFCYLSDAIRGFFTVLFHGAPATPYNVGNPDAACSIKDLAQMLTKLRPDWGLSVEQHAQTTAGYLPSPISINVPNIDKLSALGWRPTISLEEGFDRTLRFFTESYL